MNPHGAHLAAAFLVSFIFGVIVAAVSCWLARDKIRAAMMRKRDRLPDRDIHGRYVTERTGFVILGVCLYGETYPPTVTPRTPIPAPGTMT